MTIASPANFSAASPGTRGQIVLTGISFDTYRRVRAESDRLHLKMTFDRGTLEIMPPLPDHAVVTRVIDQMIGIVCEEMHISLTGYRDTTWHREALDRGLEADDCYYIQNAAIADERGIDIDLVRDPPPDLAIETDITRSSVDKESVYAALGIPELWRWDNNTLRVRLLTSEGTYVDAVRSRALPVLTPDIIVQFVARRMREGESRAKNAFREWVRARLAPGGTLPGGKA